MKRTFKSMTAMFLSLVMVLGLLAGCGKQNQPSPDDSTPNTGNEERQPLPVLEHDTYNNAAIGYEAAVVSANKYTSQIGMDILKKGGNAVDAAVAMIFANSLTEPGATTIGGAMFMTIWLKETNEYICIEGMETAPAAAGIDTLDYINETGGAALVTVPGQVHGALSALEKYGTMTREEVLMPVVELAENGFEVFTSFEERASSAYDKLIATDEAAKVYTNDGLPYAIGDHFTNPDYANTVRKIIDGGIDEFYKGSIAQTIVDYVQSQGGLLTMEDMANYTSVEREPISTTYHGYEVITHNAPSNGGAPMLEFLNILEQYDLQGMGYNTPEYLFTFNEAYRLIMADGLTYFGDPDFYNLPIETIISKEYAKQRVEEDMPKGTTINPELIAGRDLPFEKIADFDSNESIDTTHISVIDEFGNMVSCTHTIGGYFGSCLVAPGTGFALNAHLSNQKLDIAQKDNPNFVQGGLRVMSTMAPTLVVKDGEPVMAIGSPGSWCIPCSIVQIINACLLFGKDLQEAINEPRAMFTSYKKPTTLTVEPRLSYATVKALENYGYSVNASKDWNTSLGSVGCVWKTDDGFVYAGGDQRRQYQSLAY